MDDSIFIAASGMHAVERMLENSAYNTVNVNTPGFHRQKVVLQRFGDLLADAGQRADLIGTREYVSFEQGRLNPTELPFASALEGEGFYAVRDPNGRDLYTRNGDFKIDADGKLITRGSLTVLDEDERDIILDPRGGTVDIDENGNVSQGGAVVGRLRVVEFATADRLRLEAISETLYQAPEGVVGEEAKATKVRQGYLETPNFDAAQGLVQMLNARRNYEAMSKALKALDDSRDHLISGAQ
ncbi:MAG: flagellar hook basal-body protein [Planctomycetota bacterium]